MALPSMAPESRASAAAPSPAKGGTWCERHLVSLSSEGSAADDMRLIRRHVPHAAHAHRQCGVRYRKRLIDRERAPTHRLGCLAQLSLPLPPPFSQPRAEHPARVAVPLPGRIVLRQCRVAEMGRARPILNTTDRCCPTPKGVGAGRAVVQLARERSRPTSSIRLKTCGSWAPEMM